MAAASERVTPKCLVNLACQGCGSALDKTANTVDKVCQTIYCNQECLAKDTKHASWCKKNPDEVWSAAHVLKAAQTKPFLRDINRRKELFPKEREAGHFIFILNGGERSRTFTLNEFEKDIRPGLAAPLPGIVDRVKDLMSRFPITSHLVILDGKEFGDASYQRAQFHLFKLDYPSDNPSLKEEKKEG